MDQPTLTLMVGFPRSGKSTWIEKNKEDELVIEPDWIRRNILGHQYHRPAEPIIWLIADSFIRICLSQGQDVILDGINLLKFIREKYVKLAQEMGVKIRVVWITTPMEICLARNQESPEEKRLPQVALVQKEEMFEPPELEEGFGEIVEV